MHRYRHPCPTVETEAGEVRLVIPGPMPSLNQLIGGRVRDRIRIKREWKDVVIALCGRSPAFVGPVSMRYAFFEFRDGQGRDPLNILAGAAKIIEDALVTCGVLSGDHREIVKRIVLDPIMTDKARPRVEVLIEPFTE
jgi:hypothetical protein